jgi:hypothetical protein
MMPTYFKPLRRKFGVVTLAGAMAFALGWVRSEVTIDVVAVFAQGVTVNLYSQNGTIRLVATQDLSASASAFIACGSIRSMAHLPPNHRHITKIICFPESPRDALFGSLQILLVEPSYIVDYEFSYWPITIPLTLLSAWLLLSKPRKSATQPSEISATR